MEDLIGLINLVRPFRFIVMVIASVAVFAVAVLIVERSSRRKARREHEIIADAARRKSISEYELFVWAAKRWGVSGFAVEEDFEKYLTTAEVPFYIRAFVRTEQDKLPQ